MTEIFRDVGSKAHYSIARADNIEFLRRVKSESMVHLQPGDARIVVQGRPVQFQSAYGFAGCVFMQNGAHGFECIAFSANPGQIPELLQETLNQRREDVLGGIVCGPARLWNESSKSLVFRYELGLTYVPPDASLPDNNVVAQFIVEKTGPFQGGNVLFGYAAGVTDYHASTR